MIKISIKKEDIYSEDGVFSENQKEINIKIWNLVEIFKGPGEILKEKFEKLIQSFPVLGYMNLRPFERVVFDTNLTLSIDIPKSIQRNIELAKFTTGFVPEDNFTINRGLFITPTIVPVNSNETSDKFQFRVSIYNSTSFLNKVKRDEIVGRVLLDNKQSYSFNFEK